MFKPKLCKNNVWAIYGVPTFCTPPSFCSYVTYVPITCQLYYVPALLRAHYVPGSRNRAVT